MALEWYTLDDQFRKDAVIEEFESFIWTERFNDAGDFQIVIKSTYQSRTLLTPGTWITKKGSYYVMQIQTVSDQTDDTGVRNLTITGASMESLLEDRVAMPAVTDTTTTPAWVLTDTPGNICRYIFEQICVVGLISTLDTIPFYTEGTLLPVGSIEEETEEITVSTQPDTVFNVIQKICQTYFLGFRLVRNGEQSEIYFEIYTGNDLTSDQTANTPVIFDPDLDNLEAVTTLSSTALIKTVAYVFATNGSAIVYGVGADSTASGDGRHVLLVNSSNSADASEDLDAALQSEGLLALTACRQVYQFDGELPQTIPYVYGRDYNLGDLVEERDSDGIGNQMIVTEQIFSADDTGERAYPTLTIKEVITPGTWVAFDPTKDWTDEDETVVWATL